MENFIFCAVSNFKAALSGTVEIRKIRIVNNFHFGEKLTAAYFNSFCFRKI